MATIFLETFGCQMNELDSELVRSQLRSLGHSFIEDWRAADVVLFNTCSVREHAEHKAYSRLGMVGQRKRRGEQVVLGVLGCMAERDGPDMLRRYPQVDLLCGPGELDRLPLLIDNAFRSERAPGHERIALAGNRNRRTAALSAVADDLELLDLSRAFDPDGRQGRSWSAYVRITRGCNKFCTYCVVPNTRGAEVHRPPDHIVEECRRLVDAGVVEITLLGQTVNHYRYTHGTALDAEGRERPQIGPGLAAFRDEVPAGRVIEAGVSGGMPRAGDPEGRANRGDRRVTTFAALLARIHDEVPGVRRLRFVTSYPRHFGMDVLEVLASCPRIAPYIHAPAQSGSDRVLKLMNRGYTVAEYRAFVDRIFETVPHATLAGDFIVGFPTETDEDFEASLALVRELPFKNNFIFKYSPRPGTVAIDRFEDDVSIDAKKLRNNRMLDTQAETSRRVHSSWIAREVEVLVERVGESRRGTEGRSDWSSMRDGVERGESKQSAIGRTDPATGTLLALPQLGRVGARSAAPAAPSFEPRGGVTGLRSSPTNDSVEIVGRTSGDLIVSARLPRSTADRIVPGSFLRVRLDAAEPLLLRGTVVDGE